MAGAERRLSAAGPVPHRVPNDSREALVQISTSPTPPLLDAPYSYHGDVCVVRGTPNASNLPEHSHDGAGARSRFGVPHRAARLRPPEQMLEETALRARRL